MGTQQENTEDHPPQFARGMAGQFGIGWAAPWLLSSPRQIERSSLHAASVFRSPKKSHANAYESVKFVRSHSERSSIWTA